MPRENPKATEDFRVGTFVPSLASCCPDFPLTEALREGERSSFFLKVLLILSKFDYFVKWCKHEKEVAKKAKSQIKLSKTNNLSQILVALTVVLVIIASYQAVTQNDITKIAPTQLFLVAGVLGILGLYLKDEK